MMIDHELVFTQQQIRKRVREIGNSLSFSPLLRPVVFIGVLKGGFVFLADLVREYAARGPVEFEVDFITLSSYEHRLSFSGKVKILSEPRPSLKDKTVILVDDILDSGHTAKFLINYVQKQKPQDIIFIPFLVRKGANRVLTNSVECGPYGFSIDDGFVSGFERK